MSTFVVESRNYDMNMSASILDGIQSPEPDVNATTRSDLQPKDEYAGSHIKPSEEKTDELPREPRIEITNDSNTFTSHEPVTEPLATDEDSTEPGETENQSSDDAQVNGQLEKATTSANDKPYSTFTPWQKRFIVLAASTGSFISPLTTNIYFPALNTIASSLHVSISDINLSITTYMVRLEAWPL